MISRAVHILCEDFRPEERKKLALLGVFGGEMILLGPSPPGLPQGVLARLVSLCIVTTLFMSRGKHLVKVTFVAPDGQVITERTDTIEVSQASATLITKFAPFDVRSLGKYVMRYESGGSEVEFPFEIRFESDQTTQAA